jgi:hypothetical protein
VDALIDRFCQDGFVALRGAVAPNVVDACANAVDGELRRRGVDPRDRATWREPVVRFDCPSGPAFDAAGASAALITVYDALLGRDRWARRAGVGGTVPVRFPSDRDPGDAGWHIDGSYDVEGTYWANVHSRGRGLLALFLFGDVGDDDAPTELLAGSHLDVPRVLAPFGERGVFFGEVAKRVPSATFARRRVRAIGRAGDVFVCHPFLVHRATWPHRGERPRAVAQPGIAIHEPFALHGGEGVCPVERAILRGLGER